MERVLCCSCGKQINPMNPGAIRKHPWLKVVTCKKCYKFMKSGPFTMDDEGIDEQCRWCGDGGRLYGCDYCNHCFCRSCIKRNLGRSEATKMEEDDGSKWHCYMCKPKKIAKLQEECTKILDYIEKEEKKEKEKLERAKQREKEKAETAKKEKEEKIKAKAEKEEKEQSKTEKDSKEDKLIVKTEVKTPKDKNETPKRSLPIPKDKEKLVLSLKKEGSGDNKEYIKVKKDEPDLIVVDNPNEVKDRIPHFQHHRAVMYKPDINTGVEKVVKGQGNVLQVTVGPKAPVPVQTPYKDTAFVPKVVGIQDIKPAGLNTPLLASTLLKPNINVNFVKGVPGANDINAMMHGISPYNVESVAEKLFTSTQSFELALNALKTDLAISRLTSNNQNQARSLAVLQLKNGLQNYFNSLRVIFNVKMEAKLPSSNKTSSDNAATGTGPPVNLQGVITKGITQSIVVNDESAKNDKSDAKDASCVVISDVESEVATPEKKKPLKSDKIDTDMSKDTNKLENCQAVKENVDKSISNVKVIDKAPDTNEKGGNESAEPMDADTETTENSTTVKENDLNSSIVSENTAAELELLKEMEDELDDVQDESSIHSNDSSSRGTRSRSKGTGKDGDKPQIEESVGKDLSSKRQTRSKGSDIKEENDTKSKTRGSKASPEKQLKESSTEDDTEKEGSGKKRAKVNSENEETNDSVISRSSSRRSVNNTDSNTENQSIKSKDKSVKCKTNESSKENQEKTKSKQTDDRNDSDTEVEPVKLEDIHQNGDLSDSSNSSGSDFEDRAKSKRKTRKCSNKEEKKGSKESKPKQKSSQPTRKSERSSKSQENTSVNSDSDPDFDSDLENDIKKLSKDTKLTRKQSKGSKDKAEETKGKKEGKETKKTSHGSDSSKNNEEAEDYGSNTDVEEESSSQGTRSTRSKAKETKEEKEKVKDSKSKKRGKSATESDSDTEDNVPAPDDDDDDEEEENDEELSASQIKKLKKARENLKEESDVDDDLEQLSDMSSDLEVSFPKLSTPKKGGKKSVADIYSDDSEEPVKSKGKKQKKDDEMSDDSDFEVPKKKTRLRSKLLDTKVSESDSEEDVKPKKGKAKPKRGGKRKKGEETPDSEDSDGNKKKKGKGKKRRRIKKMSSSDEELEPGAKDVLASDEEMVDDPDTPGGYLKRKKIRKVQGTKKLKEETKAAQKAEEDRRKRIEERQKEYNAYVEVEGGEEEEELPEGTERETVTAAPPTDSIAQILGSPKKVPVTTKCVLEMDKEKKKILVEVDRTLVRKLKPHQVEAVRFMYNCCVENLERMKNEEGAGCILAHCMGLGKTLSVITFVHTLLSNVKRTKMTKCLVVCPLNTCLNWVNEFEIWLDDVDFEIEVYEMSKVKQNFERAQMLKEWQESKAAVLILGYDMYRNLVNGSHCKNKKQKKIFYEALADPGPDLVVCDEGHILKNDATSLSKSMSKIKTKRRVVLTGTPLQNNLGEYHCMVSFVKPNLLGTRKEFNNRFNNPITNGQCSDSTPFDVKLMKRRAHILHELLAGCVQRKDYSALTKFLPPKHEYVVSVRLSKVQMTLYEKYLELSGLTGGEIASKGARLFKDYQSLMRIWTHPWVLKLDEIRQENKRVYDESEDSFIDDSASDEDSFISGSTTSESEMSDVSAKGKSKKKGKGKGKKKASSSSDSDGEKKKADKDEVVKKWTSRRRGNEEGAGSSWMEDMGYSTGPKELSSEWWAEFVKEEDEHKLELSGKLMLLFEILKMCEDIGDKVLVFSQSLLSLDIIEDFLEKIDSSNQGETNEGETAEETLSGDKGKKAEAKKRENGEAGGSGSGDAGSSEGKSEEDKIKELKERLSQYGKSWVKGADYFRMDGSTSSHHRKAAQDMFNDPENYRARLFLISTKAGSLGINLVAANRVIIFDASWNPSHDIQSIFRVYRFGQVKPVYVYRFLAQGTMEEKIYERQVTKQSLSQRVVDEHQIERHFSASDLQELYRFTPDRLDDPDRKERPLPVLPKDHMLAELSTSNKEWIVTFHEHDSLLENIVEQELSEEEKKAAWEDYENDKKGLVNNPYQMAGGMGFNMHDPSVLAAQQMNMQNLLMQGQTTLGQDAVLQIVQDLKARFPNTPPYLFQQRVQAVLRQVLTQQIMQQSEMQRRQLEQQRMNELNRLNQIKQQIMRQQQMLNNQQHQTLNNPMRMFDAGGANRMSNSNSYSNLGNAAPKSSGSGDNKEGMSKAQSMPFLTQAIQNASGQSQKK